MALQPGTRLGPYAIAALARFQREAEVLASLKTMGSIRWVASSRTTASDSRDVVLVLGALGEKTL